MAATAETTLADIDLTDLDRWVEGVPYDWFALLRREDPAFWQDERDGRVGVLLAELGLVSSNSCRRIHCIHVVTPRRAAARL